MNPLQSLSVFIIELFKLDADMSKGITVAISFMVLIAFAIGLSVFVIFIASRMKGEDMNGNRLQRGTFR